MLQDIWELILKIGENFWWKNKTQRNRTWFLSKYGGLSIYGIDVEMRYFIDDEDIKFLKRYEYALFGNPENPDGTSTDHAYFSFTRTCLTES